MAPYKTYTDSGALYQQQFKDNQAAQQAAREQGYESAHIKGSISDTPTENTKYALQLQDGTTKYYNDDEVRHVKKGTAGADETFLSKEDYAQVQALKQQWSNANAAGDAAAAQMAHAAAEAIRAKYGYSGDTETRGDGGGYTVLPTQQPNTIPGGAGPATGAGAPNGGGNNMQSLLDQWKQAAIDQSNGQVDYAVQKAVAELERALADAQPMFKEQEESVAKDEMQALDNSALYAEARGDKGGIGRGQYNEIQAAAAQNRLAVQQAQTKLATDTARQIADLRAQGEFEKADKVLEITQQYLSQLISLEQWAAEFGLTQQQFQESIRQWESEYALAMKEFDFNVATTEKNNMAAMGEALLSAGIPLDAEQLAAMGMSEAQMNAFLRQQELEQAAGQQSNRSPDGSPAMSLTTAKQAAANGVFNDAVLSTLRANGYDDEMLSAIYGYKGSVAPTGSGYSETRNMYGQSEWDRIVAKISSALRGQNYTEAEKLMDQYAGGMNENQMQKAIEMLRAAGYEI